MFTQTSRKRGSSLALAVALATGSAVVATALFPTEASAQRRDRDRNSDDSGGGYSDAFLGVYSPLEQVMQDAANDLTAYKPQFVQLGGMTNTNDEKDAAGRLILNAGVRLQDQSLQLLGLERMIVV